MRKKRIVHTKQDMNLFAFSISFDEMRGLIGFDFAKHSWLIRLYSKDGK